MAATILDVPDHARIAPRPDVLARILDREVTLAVWDRPCPFEIGMLGSFDDVRFVSAARDVPTLLATALACDPTQPWHGPLVADAASLAARFAQVMGAAFLEVRLERLTGNACWKFHADYVTARLITTYLGEGTQWLDEDNAKSANPGLPHQLNTGAVGLFKGREWALERAIIHRSPPIAGTGSERLLLVIDPACRPAADAG